MNPLLSLCSGIGGLDIAATRLLGGEVSQYAEIEKSATTVMCKRFPDAENVGDVTRVETLGLYKSASILTAGYPCQPFSVAGTRAGDNDPRHLWPDILTTIRHVSPERVVLENVPGHLSLGFNQVLADMAASGYDVRWRVHSAAQAGAPHLRKRLFVLASRTNPTGYVGGVPEKVHPFGGLVLGEYRGDRYDPSNRAPRHKLLPTITVQDGENNANPSTFRRNTIPLNARATIIPKDWGEYRDAIKKWERVMGDPAPSPTEPTGPNGREQLSARFCEWFQGFPRGWVTGVPGVSRSAAIRLFGNSVNPIQGADALRRLAEEGRDV